MLRKYSVLASAALMLLLLTSTVTAAQDEEIRHSPEVIVKILGQENVSLSENLTGFQNMSDILNGLSNPNVSSTLTEEDIASLQNLTSETAYGSMPEELRYDLSMASGYVSNDALREVLMDWATKGYMDLNELQSKVDLESLSPEDLAVLKSVLGLAAKYGLVSEADINSLGLGDISPEDLQALADILREIGEFSGNASIMEGLSSAATRLEDAAFSGRPPADALSEVLENLNASSTMPYIARSLVSGLTALSGGLHELPSQLPEVMSVDRSAGIEIPSVEPISFDMVWFAIMVAGAVLAVVAAYLAYHYLKPKVTVFIMKKRLPKEVKHPTIDEGSVNGKIILMYWEAVNYLKSITEFSESETHREFLKKVKSLVGTEFEELTSLYEVARWSGRKLREEHLSHAAALLNRLKSSITATLGGVTGE